MGTCACVYIDADWCNSFYSTRIRKARKEHKCQECNRTIEVGEEYEYATQKMEGEEGITDHKTCLDCKSIIKTFFCDGYYYGMIYENLWEHLTEINGEIGCGCTEGLTEKAKEKIFSMMDEIFYDYFDDDEEETGF